MDILEFEKKYKDKLENIEEWNYLRIQVGFYLKNQNNKSYDKRNKKNIFFDKLRSMILLLKNSFFGFKNWFRNYDYIFLSTSDQRKLVDGNFYDKLCDPIIDEFNKRGNRSLIIEKCSSKRFKKVKNQNIVAKELIEIVYLFFYKISFLKKKKSPISKIINLDYNRSIQSFKISYRIYILILTIYKPKAIFVVCAYTHMPIIKASKKLGIKTIELQHGVISKEHFGYISKLKIKNRQMYLPDILLTFGNINIDNFLINDTYPIGHFYLEYIRSNFKIDKKLSKLINNYNMVIGVSMQISYWEIDSLIIFINKVALIKKDILFVLIPRNNTFIDMKLPSNIIVYNDLDCYNIILHCNIHMTLYSSCAIEVLALGVPNILYNYKNFAKKYYENILNNFYTEIIDSEENFLEAVEKFSKIDKQDILHGQYNVIRIDYRKNIKKFMKENLK